MFDMMKIMGQIKEAQSKIKAAQESLVNLRVEGEAGAGRGKAVMNGEKMLREYQSDK